MWDEMFEKLGVIQFCQIMKGMDLHLQRSIILKNKDLHHLYITQFHYTFLAPTGIWVYRPDLASKDLNLNSGSTTS